MKKILSILACVLVAATIYAGTTTNFGWDYGTKGQSPWWDVWTVIFQSIDTEVNTLKLKLLGYDDARRYASINAAVTAIGSTQTTLVVSNSQTLTANLTIPSTLTLMRIRGGSITKASTYTLTINGKFVNPDNGQAFIGFSAGDVTFAKVKEIHPEWWGENTTPLTTDMTDEVKNAVAAYSTVKFDGSYKFTDEIILNSNQEIILSSKTILRQYTADKNIFKATSKDNIWINCNGAVLYGEGTWNNVWTDVSGHEDRAIQFINCTRSGIAYPTIKNCSAAGIAIISGSRIRIIVPTIEGTNEYSTVIPYAGNHQFGIFLSDSVAYGALDDVVIVAPDVSGTAQGIGFAAQVGAADTDVGIQIIGPNIHDITGQHAFYITRGKVAISNPTLSDIALDGFKIVSADSNKDIKGFSVTGAVASDLGGNLFNLGVTGTGSLSGLLLSGTGDNIGGYGIAISGGVSNVKADLQLTDCGNPVYIYGDIIRDIDITVSAKDSHGDGILITATNAIGIRIRPTLRESNVNAGANQSGITINGATATVDIYDPEVTDSNGRMQWGLYVASGDVGVWGSAKFTGALQEGVRAGVALRHWPDHSVVSGTTGSYNNYPYFEAPHPPLLRYSTIPLGDVAYGSLGTSTTPVNGTIYWAEINIARLKGLTGIGILNAATVGTDAVIGALYNSAGTLVANTALAGTTTAGANVFQEVAFTSTYIADSGRYWVAIQFNGTTDRFRTIAASTFVDVKTTSATGVFGTLTALTVPTTFTADKGPIAYLY